MVGVEIFLDQEKTLEEVKFYITDYGKPNAPFSISLYKFSSLELPDKHIPLMSKPTDSISVDGEDWTSVDFKKENIRLSPGKYLISLRWLELPGDDGRNSFTIGFKEDEEHEPISWMNWSGECSDWSKDTGPYIGNFMLQSVFS